MKKVMAGIDLHSNNLSYTGLISLAGAAELLPMKGAGKMLKKSNRKSDDTVAANRRVVPHQKGEVLAVAST